MNLLAQQASIIAGLDGRRVSTLRSLLRSGSRTRSMMITVHADACRQTLETGPCSCFPAFLICGARA